MPNTKRDESQQAFKEAWQFEQVGGQLERVKPKSDSIFYPWPMNLSFALELYLKCLFALEHRRWLTKKDLPQSEWHDLFALFSAQTSQSQKEIVAIYNGKMSAAPSVPTPPENSSGGSKGRFQGLAVRIL